jgi:hypothetical protein
MSNLITRPPTYALETMPDNDRYKCRYKIASQDSGRVYTVSFDMAIEAWSCSCRGCISHGQCKHLTAAGLYGRKSGRNPRQARLFLDGDTRRSVIPSLPELQKIVGKETKPKKQKALPMSDDTRAVVEQVLRIKKTEALPAPAGELLEM